MALPFTFFVRLPLARAKNMHFFTSFEKLIKIKVLTVSDHNWFIFQISPNNIFFGSVTLTISNNFCLILFPLRWISFLVLVLMPRICYCKQLICLKKCPFGPILTSTNNNKRKYFLLKMKYRNIRGIVLCIIMCNTYGKIIIMDVIVRPRLNDCLCVWPKLSSSYSLGKMSNHENRQ